MTVFPIKKFPETANSGVETLEGVGVCNEILEIKSVVLEVTPCDPLFCIVVGPQEVKIKIRINKHFFIGNFPSKTSVIISEKEAWR